MCRHLRAALFITQPLCFRHVTDFAETWLGGSWGPEMTPRHFILGSCWVKSGFRGHFPERGSKIQDSFFGRSLFIVQCIKKLHFIFQQDLWPSSAHVEGQLCSSKDVDSTALASFGTFLVVAFLNGNVTQKFLDVPNARDIPVVLSRFGLKCIL